jgi:hypothetical protein
MAPRATFFENLALGVRGVGVDQPICGSYGLGIASQLPIILAVWERQTACGRNPGQPSFY